MRKVKVIIVTKKGTEIVINSWVQNVIVNGFYMMVAGWAGHVYYSSRLGVFCFTTKEKAETHANALYNLGLISKAN